MKYTRVKDTPVHHSVPVGRLVIDLDADGEVVGVEELDAPRQEITIDPIRVGMLRQWLNEDRGCKPLVTNKDIMFWLTGDATQHPAIAVELTTEHKPGTPSHQQQVILNYLRSKGCVIRDGKLVI
jgi:hypothetical protein